MMNIMKVVISIFILMLSCCFDRCVAIDECGMLLSAQLYCPSNYHCCDKTLSTCCGDSYICSGSVCIHLGVIIAPCVIAVGVIVGIIICCVCCKKKAHTGTVVQDPGVQQQTFGQPPPYGQPAYGQPVYGQPAYGQPAPSFGIQQQQQQQEEQKW